MKKLKVGADPFPPYQYFDQAGELCGSDYEIVNSVIKKMGYEAEYIIEEWPVIEKMFNEKEIDVAFQVQKTSAREGKYIFSDKLRDAVTAIITYKDDIKSDNLSDLLGDNNKLAVKDNYQYGRTVDNINSENKEAFDSLESLLDAVNSKEISFGVVDLGVFNYANRDNKYPNINVIDGLNFNRDLYVIFNDRELRDKFNIYLKESKNK